MKFNDKSLAAIDGKDPRIRELLLAASVTCPIAFNVDDTGPTTFFSVSLVEKPTPKKAEGEKKGKGKTEPKESADDKKKKMFTICRHIQRGAEKYRHKLYWSGAGGAAVNYVDNLEQMNANYLKDFGKKTVKLHEFYMGK